MAAYHQYYAVNKAVESTLRAVDLAGERRALQEAPAAYGLPSVQDQPKGDRKAGVVWHTQGSGKSLSMVFYTGKIVLTLDNPTVVVITDRNDLDDQLFDTFEACKQLLRQDPVQSESRAHLKTLLKVASGGVVFTTIQKFQPKGGNIYETLSERKNIVVIADEAHRTQYDFRAKTIDEKDEQGNVTGKKVVYGFAKYLRDALPQATYLGFTGTPIESTDINTPAVFGHYVDIYDIAQAVEDGATVRIFYESRLAKIEMSARGQQLVRDLDADLAEDDLTETQKAKARWTQLESLVGSEQRLKTVAQDIVAHFEQRQTVFEGKAMIVTMSRRIAAAMYREIVALRPEWHHPDLSKGMVKVVMTAASSDGPEMAQHHTTKDQRRGLAECMKTPGDDLKIVIVCDMWLTGFDVPSLDTMYLDKPMRGHNLMQAIALVNRVYKDKPGGLIVDYLGIAADLKKALSFYSDSGGKGDLAVDQEQAVALMLEKMEVVAQMFHGFAYEEYFSADTSRKLSLILAAEDFILGLEDGRRRYINEVTALSQAFAIAIPHEGALAAKDEVAFFQAIRARLVKFDSTGSGRTGEELETAIRQVIDQALVSEQVIDIFDAAGLKKPDISILSEEFLLEIKGMEHKNVALEVLRKLLNDEIKARARKNLVQSQSLMEMLEQALKRYHNKAITSAEVIEELIHLAKDIREMDGEAEAMGLSEFEYAFYTAVADNDSARELMQQDKLRELAVVLTERVRQNTSIDWTIKESVQAKLRVIVKRTLRQYGYPRPWIEPVEITTNAAEHVFRCLRRYTGQMNHFGTKEAAQRFFDLFALYHNMHTLRAGKRAGSSLLYEKPSLVLGTSAASITILMLLISSVQFSTQALNQPRQPLPEQGDTIPGYPCYRTVEETFNAAQQIVAAYPNLAAWYDIGDSWEKTQDPLKGYDMMVLVLTNANVMGPKPKLFLTSSIHAREYTPAELSTRFAEFLVQNYNVDPDVTWLLDYGEIHLMLHANPDGRKKAETGLLWRKNTNDNYCSNTSSRGVDLNRNFEFQWGCCGGSSRNQCNNTYRGPSPVSDPETQAIQNYLRAIFPDQRNDPLTDPAPADATGIYMDIHSYSELVLWPWGFTGSPTPNGTAMQTLGRKLAFFNDYTPKQAIGLYLTDGTAVDFGYGDLGVPSYVFELGTTFFQSCTIFDNTILPDNLPAYIYAAKVARAPYVTPAGPEASNVTVSDAQVFAGEPVTLDATLDDTRFSNRNGAEPVQDVAAAEYYIDIPPWVTTTVPISLPMSPADGSFDDSVETAAATVDTSSLSEGRHTIFVRGQDAAGNWGAFSAVFLWVDVVAPPNPMDFKQFFPVIMGNIPENWGVGGMYIPPTPQFSNLFLH